MTRRSKLSSALFTSSCAALIFILLSCEFFDYIPSTIAEPETSSPPPPPTASLSISDGSTFDYGNVAVGASSDKTFTVTNSGLAAATSLASALTGSNFIFVGASFPGGGTCGSELAVSATCTIIVRFIPQGYGAKTEIVTLSYHDGVSTVTTTRAIQGTGATPASLSLSDGPSYNFGNITIGNNQDKGFTVTNAGGAAATGLSGSITTNTVYSFTGGSFPGSGGTCSTTLIGSGTCIVVVRFSPTAGGGVSDTLTLNYSTGVSSASASGTVTGTGLSVASLSILPTSHDFSSQNVGTTTDSQFTITNNGETAASIMLGLAFGNGVYSFPGGYPGGGTCSETLAASPANCTVKVRFAPTSNGTITDTLSISYTNGVSGGGSSTLTAGVSGTGQNGGTAVASGTLDTSFHFDGKSNQDLSTADRTYSILAQPDGKLVVGGSKSNAYIYLSRYLTNGDLDTSFNSDGKFADINNTGSSVYDLALQGDGSLLAATSQTSGTSVLIFKRLYRFTPSGSIDTSFNTNGYALMTFAFGGLYGSSVTLQPDGKTVTQSVQASMPVMMYNRFMPTGELDTSFHTDGTGHWVASEGYSAIEAIPKIRFLNDGGFISISSGYRSAPFNGFDWLLARIRSDASLDTSFATSGLTAITFTEGIARTVAVDTSGRYIIFGNSMVLTHAAIGRFLPDGNVDTSFNTNGFAVSTSYTLYGGMVHGAKALAVGEHIDFSSPYMERRNTDGSLDTSFNTTGTFSTNYADTNAAHAITRRPTDGTFCMASYTLSISSETQVTCLTP